MQKLYHVFQGVVSPNKCNEIIARGMALPAQDATIGFSEDNRLENTYRSSTIRWFYAPDNKDIADLIFSFANYANREHFGFDISFGPYDLQFTEYKATSGGKYEWHHDVFWTNPRLHDRKLSVVIQLNDPRTYTGGDFEFRGPHDPSELQGFKTQGSVLVFPSFFEHRVTQLTAGSRYSLVSWIDGPKFR